MANNYESGKDRQMKIYNPNELPKLVEKAIAITANGDRESAFELWSIMNNFMLELDKFIDKHSDNNMSRFKFKIEPIRFKGDDDGKRQNR